MYPKEHKNIVTSLLEGKFITVAEKQFEVIKNKEGFYITFFEKSFGLELLTNIEYYYLISAETNENTSRDISIFFAILCEELDKDNRNFMEELNYSTFGLDEIFDYFQNSSREAIIKVNKSLNSLDNLKGLLRTMMRRNIVVKQTEDSYTFTKAYKVFTEFAKELVKKKEIEEN